MSADDARGWQGSVPGRPLRPSLSCLSETALGPSHPAEFWTDGTVEHSDHTQWHSVAIVRLVQG